MAEIRRIAVIMFTDIVGYTAMMGDDEQKALSVLKANKEIHQRMLRRYHGKFLKEMGDGILASFDTVSDAVYCAGNILQQSDNIQDLNLRIGIHLGEVTVHDNELYGDGVNIASRIENLANGGQILVSEDVYNNIRNRSNIRCTSIGARVLKNVAEPVKIYEIVIDELPQGSESLSARKSPLGRALVVAGLAALIILTWLFLPDGSKVMSGKQSYESHAIAVLPFQNMSNDPDQEYFSDGITEDIITQLSKITQLKVTSRTSVMQYKDIESKNLREIGKALGVGTVLEGSVRRSGNTIRIVAQLINAQTDSHLWAETYDRDIEDIFAIQTDVATQIAKALKATLTPQEQQSIKKKYTTNVDAYELYLKGRFYWNQRLEEPMNVAIGYFQRALQKDSAYALAYSGLADAYLMLGVYGVTPPAESFPLAEEYANKALSIDHTLAEAYATLQDIYIHYYWDEERAEQYFQQAIRYDPNHANAYHWHTEVCVMRGDFSKSLQESDIALRLEPSSVIFNMQRGMMYTYAGAHDSAIAQFLHALERDSTAVLLHHRLAVAYAGAKEFDKGAVHARLAHAAAPNSTEIVASLAFFEGASGNMMNARQLNDHLISRSESAYVPPYDLAVGALSTGDPDKAMEYLGDAFDERGPWMPFIHLIPFFESLHRRQDFQEIVRKVRG